MSGGYASRLKEYPHKGICGLPELSETRRSLSTKVNQLVEWVKDSQHTVVLTGAGISTSCGIPDFRGPNGIWTLEKEESRAIKRSRTKRQRRDRNSNNNDPDKRNLEVEVTLKQSKGKKRSREPTLMDFSQAKPSRTHNIITKLVAIHQVQFCITQNVDGLHRRSGLSKAHHAVLHGCVFTETCEQCGAEHFRTFEVGGMSFQKTGRKCEHCKTGDLRDTLLDWEDELPEGDFARATTECEKADLAICLGTSLRIEPAGSLPTYAKRFVIVNLQETPYDQQASLLIRGRVDEVMQGVMERLGLADWEDSYVPPETEVLYVPPKSS